uniref:Ubiquitin-like domain-containing protein n=1 Tax=Caenorhabditis tropicalis TaxID=1561998 RepID=A0A1I7U597_9PELO
MPPKRSAGVVSNVAFEEMRKEQTEFKKEVLETLQLIRQEIKGNQEKSEEQVMNKLQLMMNEQKKLQDEQQKMLGEVETIRNDVKCLKKDSEAQVPNKQVKQEINESSSKEAETMTENIKITVFFWTKTLLFHLEMFPTDTILDLKKRIEAKEEINVPVQEQKLLFNGEECENHRTLDECGIITNSALNLRIC